MPHDNPDNVTPTPLPTALARRDYRALANTDIGHLIREAAADMDAHGLVDEAGALRIVLTRLVTEEGDLKDVADRVTRVASAAARVATSQRQLRDKALVGLNRALDDVLAEIAACKEDRP